MFTEEGKRELFHRTVNKAQDETSVRTDRWKFMTIISFAAVPDGEVHLLPLKLGQAGSFFRNPQQNGSAPTGFVHTQAPRSEAAVHAPDQRQHRPHVGAQSRQLGLGQGGTVRQLICADVTRRLVVFPLKLQGAGACQMEVKHLLSALEE